MRDTLRMRGRYRIEARDPSGRLLRAWALDNTLMDASMTVRAQMLQGAYSGSIDDLAIRYFAFGTGVTPPTGTDAALENEVFRKPITHISSPETGIVRSVVSLGAGECNTTIREIGVFCGPEAAQTANTGLLLSRVVVNIDKNSNIVLNIVRTDICTI